jgi:hypothetical protein
MITADMVPDAPGIWLYHCHISDHMLAGMDARYEVTPRWENASATRTTNKYLVRKLTQLRRSRW